MLLLHPAVAQCVTFAAPHPTLGEEAPSSCATRPFSMKDLNAFASSRLVDFKVPRQIVFVSNLPKGPSGKLQRVGLANRLGATFYASSPRSAVRGAEELQEAALRA